MGTVVLDSPKGLVSTGNASTTPLAAGATFTGTAEQNFFSDVMVPCYSDAAGTLYLEFSSDGTNWHAIPSAGISVGAGEFVRPIEAKGAMRFRARFVDGGSGQSAFRLATYYGSFLGGPDKDQYLIGANETKTLGRDGDVLSRIVIPAALVAALTISDGATTVMTFPIGFGPQSVDVGAQSVGGGWSAVIGASDSVVFVGSWT